MCGIEIMLIMIWFELRRKWCLFKLYVKFFGCFENEGVNCDVNFDFDVRVL